MVLRWLVNLILFLMLLGLAAGVWYVLRVEEAPTSLTGLNPADLKSIEVERVGEPRIRLERTPDGWRMREPMDLDADPDQVARVLRVLSLPVDRSFPAQSAALGELGLAPPKLLLRLDQTALGLGGLEPLKQHRYVLADALVHLVADDPYPRLIAPPVDYLSRRLLPAAPPPVYATLNAVPLAAPSLKALAALTAERLEPMGNELGGEPLAVKLGDGTLLRFLVSPDRRRWTRTDQRVCYVLGDSLLLELDPAAPDPGPPARPPAPARTRAAVADPGAVPTWGAERPAGAPSFATEAQPEAAPSGVDPFAPDPDLVTRPAMGVPDPAPAGSPPVVHLRPNQVGPNQVGPNQVGPNPVRPNQAHPAPEAAGQEPGVGFGAEPDKRPPLGFGVDPFAPAGAAGQQLPAGAWPAPRSRVPRGP